MTNEQYKFSELTGLIIGCAMEVHRQLGNGFQEVIYQRALAIEFELKSISAEREYEMPIYYLKSASLKLYNLAYFVF